MMSSKRDLTEQDARRYRRAGKKEKGRILDRSSSRPGTAQVRDPSVELVGTYPRGAPRRKLVKLVVNPRRAKRRLRPRQLRPGGAGCSEADLVRVRLHVRQAPGGRAAHHAADAGVVRRDRATAPVRASCRPSAPRPSTGCCQERARLRLKGRTHTAQGTLLKDQIAIRTFADWDDRSRASSRWAMKAATPRVNSATPSRTDVDTGGSTCMACRTRRSGGPTRRSTLPVRTCRSSCGASIPMVASSSIIICCAIAKRTASPSPVGARMCKNDRSCYVEQKNAHVVRRAGYLRYDTTGNWLPSTRSPPAVPAGELLPASVKLVKNPHVGQQGASHRRADSVAPASWPPSR